MAATPRSNLFSRSDDAIAFPANTTLFQAGDEGDFMYVVKTGDVDLIVDGEVVETAGPGAIFGEFALLDSRPRSSTAVTRTDCELVKVDQRRFTFLVQQTPFFALDVMRTLTERLRRMNERMVARGEQR